MELCGGGTLAQFVRIRPLSEPLARFYFLQLVSAVIYCHSKGVVHRDLKLENLMLSNNGNLKVTDFGHSGIYKKGWDVFSTSMVGSLWHVSPEQVRGTVYRGEKVDVWAMGVVLYRMLSGGLPPFGQENAAALLKAVTEARYEVLPTTSDECNDMISSILVVDSEERPSAAELQDHPWCIGESNSAILERLEFIMGSSTNIEKLWSTMKRAADEMRLVYTEPTKHSDSLTLKRMKCHYAEQEMKFGVALMTIKPIAAGDEITDPPYFEMRLQLGQGADFIALAGELRRRMRGILEQDQISKLELADLAVSPIRTGLKKSTGATVSSKSVDERYSNDSPLSRSQPPLSRSPRVTRLVFK